MTDIVISNLLGFMLGILSSFVSWWVLFHGLVPKVAFGESIRKSPAPDDPSGWKYAFQFGNLGRRSLVDVQVSARLSFERIDLPGIWNNVTLALDWGGDKKIDIPRIPPKNYRALRVFTSQVQQFLKSSLFAEDIRRKAADGSLSLEDLLAPSGKALLKVYVAGYDELSGARRVFESKEYKLEDIVEGKFTFPAVVPDVPSGS